MYLFSLVMQPENFINYIIPPSSWLLRNRMNLIKSCIRLKEALSMIKACPEDHGSGTRYMLRAYIPDTVSKRCQAYVIEERKWTEAQSYIEIVAETLKDYTSQVRKAADLIK